MKNILVPVGSSKNAVHTLQYAIDFAQQIDANVYVISVFQEFSRVGGMTKVNTLMKEDTEFELEAVMGAVDCKSVSVVSHPIKGGLVEGVTRFNNHIPIDLMILEPQCNSAKEEEYLGSTSGSLVKNTNIPALIVPEDTFFEMPKAVLMAFKNGNFPKKRNIEPLNYIVQSFKSDLRLLHVHTPETTDAMKKVSGKLKKLGTTYKETENATTYLGVLEHLQSNNPDMVCVVRRKRGFFKKLWEKNVVLKKEFHINKPLLILGVQE